MMVVGVGVDGGGVLKKCKKAPLAAAETAAAGRGGRQKNLSAPLSMPAEQKILVLLSASVERFGVSRMPNFFLPLSSYIYFVKYSWGRSLVCLVVSPLLIRDFHLKKTCSWDRQTIPHDAEAINGRKSPPKLLI